MFQFFHDFLYDTGTFIVTMFLAVLFLTLIFCFLAGKLGWFD